MKRAGNERNRGLSPEEVERSRREHGANVLKRQKRKSFFGMFFANLGDPVIKVLLAALFINLLFLFRSGDLIETVGIAASVFLATFISTVSEYRSEAAFSRLSDACGTALCRVRRGEIVEIDAAEVVVGDILLLSAGERVAADGELIGGALSVDQSALTGESCEVEKCVDGEKAGEKKTPASPDAVFAGCTVLSGEGEMRVSAVGDRTFLGGISGELQSGGRESPLKEKLTQLAHQISRIGYVAAIVCALAFLVRRLAVDTGFTRDVLLFHIKDASYMTQLLLRTLMIGLTVVVVAVPEGLPMMIAVVLSSNIRRMARDGVLVRKPAGLEAAGGMNILFTDKTGTLTGGKMSVGTILTAKDSFRSVAALKKREAALYQKLLLSVHANTGAVRGTREGREAALGGNATDRALLSPFLESAAPSFSVRERLAFDSSRKYAAVALSGGTCFFTGAPELLMPHVTRAFSGEGVLDKAGLLEEIRSHTAKGERVILLCEGRGNSCTLPHDLTLLAAICLCDPIRAGAPAAVRTLRRAGVQVVMMTGDGMETATRIARDVGILDSHGICLDGGALAAMSDAEVGEILPHLAVISRALPADKSRLVRISAARGLVVGMTGDGINDAPALKAADVGFAMGSGTQVAKEAGDVVILDDDLASIARAVLYGRTIFKSIRKFITLQLVMNFCAVGISIIGPFIGFDAPVTVVQMLWINLIMDTLGGLAFAGEAPMPHYMKEPPKRRSEPILTRAIAARIAFLSIATVALSVVFLKSSAVRALYRESEGNVCLLTAFFALFIFAGVLNCLNARTDRVSFFAGLGKNRAFLLIMTAVAAVQVLFIYLGGAVLRTVPLTPSELGATLLLSLLVLPIGWLHLLHRRLSGKGGLY